MTLIKFWVGIHEESPAEHRLNRREGNIAISDLPLSDRVAGHPGHQGGLLLGDPVGDGDGDNIDAALFEISIAKSQEFSDNPAGQLGLSTRAKALTGHDPAPPIFVGVSAESLQKILQDSFGEPLGHLEHLVDRFEKLVVERFHW